MQPPPGYEYQSETAKRFIALGRQEGLLEGRVEGRVEGRTEGEVRVVYRLLEKRFGALSATVRQRLGAASLDELDRWADRILDAATLDEVFES